MSDKPDKTYTPHPDYEELPKAIQCLYSPKEYAWLPEEEKRNIINDNTMPETFDD